MNIERLDIIAKWLEDGAQHVDNHGFNMNTWYAGGEHDYKGNECGTAMCIGGAAEQFFSEYQTTSNSTKVEVKSGSEILGLDYDTAYDLFYPDSYLFESYDDITPFMAAVVIRHLIATGEVDWGIVT